MGVDNEHKVLEKNCHVVDGVVAWGQIVKDIFFNEEVVNALDKTKLSKTKLEIIKTAQQGKCFFERTAIGFIKYPKIYQWLSEQNG